ncbi:MAG: ABC transporter permease [Gemmatimonadota bacterium]
MSADTELPSWAQVVVRLTVPEDERESVTFELAEAFAARVSDRGDADARRWLRRQVAGFALRLPRLRSTSTRTQGGGGMSTLASIGSDVRWAVRTLRRRPGFTAVAVATLGLGMGANAAILTLANAHFFSDLPYGSPDELVLLWETGRNTDNVTTVAPGNYWSWRDEAASFSDIAAYNVDFATLSGDDTAERVAASRVTPNFFDVLEASAGLGGTFVESVVRSNSAQVILSHGLWTRRYGADPGLIGESIRIDGRPFTVLGVMPPTFRQPEASLSWQRAELWRPMLLDEARDDHGSRYLRAVARLENGVTVESARAEMNAIASRLSEAFPDSNAGRGVLTFTLDEYLLGDARPTLVMLLVAGFGVLLIVCANVANLTLARGEERRSEFALRAALGSGTGRLVRQLAVESVVLALAGAAVGTVALFVGRDLMQSVHANFFTGLVDAAVDGRVIAMTAAGAVALGLACSLPLALMATRSSVREDLASGGRGGGRRRDTARTLLVVGQVGLSTTLVVLAALLARSFQQLVSVDPGFDAEGVIAFSLGPSSAAYPERDDHLRYHTDVLTQLRGTPGVADVALVSDLLFTTENMFSTVQIDGLESDPADPPRAEYRIVTPNYFDVLSIPLLEGTLPEEFVVGDELPIVINAQMARRYWPAGNALGATAQIEWMEPSQVRIVAVVGDVLDDGYDATSDPFFYLPYGMSARRRMAYMVRAQADPGQLAAPLTGVVAAHDPDVPVGDLTLMTNLLAESVTGPRAASGIGALLAIIALIVSATGIYGVIAYTVQRRTRELGIRAALGAARGELVAMVVRQSGRSVFLGLALGTVGALVAGRRLAGMLFGVQVWDPLSLVSALLVLGSVGALASWIPARRALRIEPRDALRS